VMKNVLLMSKDGTIQNGENCILTDTDMVMIAQNIGLRML